MKLRLLAAKLGSTDFEIWVKHEAEGYPQVCDVPDYRQLGMSISGHFDFGLKRVNNAPIPPALIEQIAGKGWSQLQMRESAASIDAVLQEGNGINLDLSNLILLIQGKIYAGSACQQVTGFVGHAAIVEVSNSIRNRILELTIELEKRISGIGDFQLQKVEKQPEVVSQIFHQTIHGTMTNIQSSGDDAHIQIAVQSNDVGSLKAALSEAGMNSDTSAELAELISSEKPKSDEPSGLSAKVRNWLSQRLNDGVDEGIKGGVGALSKVAQEAAMQYWGLK